MTVKGKQRFVALVKWTAFALPIAGLLVYVGRNYVLVPHSDPANWILLAQQLGESETPHRYPIGYPLYLRLIGNITGPFYIFFANIPWLLAFLILTGVATYHMLRPDRSRERAALAGLWAMFFLLAAGREVWIALVNPYRDPLAHTFLLGAVALVFAAFHSHRPGRAGVCAAGAGLCIGLGYCVREPTVLAAPFLLFLVWATARRHNRSAWAGMAVFLAGVGLGALPVLWQSWYGYGQIAVSPYSLHEGRITPGFYWSLPAALSTGFEARHFFLRPLYGFFLFCALSGAFFAFGRKFDSRGRMLTLLALVYFVLYSFYWRFYSRYFFVVSVLAAPLAALGFLAWMEWIASRLRLSETRAYAAAWIPTALLGLAVLIPCARAFPNRDRLFRLDQARQLAFLLQEHVPREAIILAPHRLAQVILTLTPLTAHPPEIHWGAEPAPSVSMTNLILALQADYGEVYWMETERRRVETLWREPLADVAAFILIGRWPTVNLNLQRVFGHSPFMLYRLVPHRLTIPVDLPPEPGLLQFSIPPPEPDATAHHITIRHGTNTWERTEPGVHMLYVVPEDDIDGEALTMISRYPYSILWGPEWKPAYAPFRLTFGRGGIPHAARLFPDYPSGNFHDADAGMILPPVSSINLPTVWPDTLAALLAQWHFEADDSPPQQLVIGVPPDTVTVPWPKNRQRLVHVLELSAYAPAGSQSVTLSWLPETAASHVMLQSILLHPVSLRDWRVDIGSAHDRPFLEGGFHGREKDVGIDRYFRWTGPEAHVALYPGRRMHDRIIEITLLGARPAEAPDPELRLALNGVPLIGAVAETDASGFPVLRVEVPSNAWRAGRNTLTLTCTPWTPRDVLGAGDRRALGVALESIRLY